MVTNSLTWVYDHNYAVAGADLLGQYQNSLFRKKQFLTGAVGSSSSGPWTVPSSSNGTTASAADNWATSADVNPNSAGNAHSWIQYQSPSGMMLGGNSLYWLIDCVDASPGTPDAANFYVATQPFTGGSTTARPTSTTEVVLPVSTFSTGGFVPRTAHGWRTTRGDWVYVILNNGGQVPTAAFICAKCDNGESSLLWPAFCYFNLSTSNPGGALGATDSFLFSSNWRTFSVTGSPAGVSGNATTVSITRSCSSWTAGVSNANTVIADAPIDGLINSGATGGYVGRFVDIRSCPQNTVSGTSQAPQDPDPIVRKSVGGLWLPTPTGTVLSF